MSEHRQPQDQMNSTYSGSRNIEFAKGVVSACAEKFTELAKGHEEEFPTKHQDGTVMHGYCAIFHNRKAI